MNSTNEILEKILESGKLAEIIGEIKEKTFDSHKFIQLFAKHCESEYIQILAQCEAKTDIFRTVHSQIALFLKANQSDLGITKGKDVMSQDIFGIYMPNTNWSKNI